MLDVGTLTGNIELNDQLSSAMSVVVNVVKKAADEFKNLFGFIAIGALGAITAITGMTTAIVAMGVRGSTINDVEESFGRLAEQAGSTGDALIGALTSGVKGTIDSMELMQTTTRALQAGVKLTEADMKALGATARAMGKATGSDATQGLNTLSMALTTGRTRGLALAGVTVDIIKAETDLAKQLGTTRDQLSQQGKLHAARTAIMEASRLKLAQLGDAELSFKEKVLAAKVSIGNWFDELQKAVAASPEVNRAFDAVGKALVEAFGGSTDALLKNIIKGINMFADAVTAAAPLIVTFANAVSTTFRFFYDNREVLGAAAVAFGVVQGAIVATSAAAWLNVAASGAMATGLTGVKIAMAGFMATSGPLILAIAAITTAVYAGKLAWDNYKQSQENAQQSSAIDARNKQNLIDLNTRYGTSFNKLEDAVRYANKRIAEGVALVPYGPNLPTELEASAMKLAALTSALDLNKDALIDHTDAQKEAAKAAAELAASWMREEERLRYQTFRLGESAVRASQNVAGFGIRMSETVAINRDFSQVLTASTIKTDSFGHVLKVNLEPTLGEVSQRFEEAEEHAVGFGDALKSIVTGKGFGDLGKALKGSLEDVKRGIFEGFGNLISNGITSLISGGISLLGKGIKKLWGNLFGTAGRDAVRAFADTQGGFDTLHTRLGQLGADGERLWISLTQGVGRNNAEGAKAAIEEVTTALAEQEQQLATLKTAYDDVVVKMGAITDVSPELQTALDAAFDATNLQEAQAAMTEISQLLDEEAAKTQFLNETMTKYGLTWQDAGEKARAAYAATAAAGLEKEFRALLEAGIDVNNIMRHMGTSINEFVTDAVKTGTEVPESFRDVIQTAMDAGEIFDINGVKITDMSKLGIEFGTTMERATANVATAIERLAKVLEDRLGPAIRNIPDVDVEISAHYNPSGNFPQDMEPTYAAGGATILPFPGQRRGTDSVPVWASPGERVLSVAQNREYESGGGGGKVVIEVPVNMDGREVARTVAEYLPEELRAKGII